MGNKYLLALAVGALMLVACGDDVTEVNEIHQDGMAVLEAGEKLSKQACDTTNVGEMLFVMDSSEAFICDGKSWQTLKGEKGEDGGKGNPGKDGDNGTSCIAKSVKNKSGLEGLEVTCGETVIDTIWNGKDGQNGNNGTSCTATVNQDGSFDLVCGGQKVGTITNGEDGVGCTLDDEGDGKVTVSCGKGSAMTTTILYKAVCGTVAYDPTKAFCSEGELFSCDDKPYNPKKQFCDTRDNQIYGYVTIAVGDYAETWMAENLNYSVNPGKQSWCGGGKSGSTNEGDCSVYGRLYTWAAAIDSVALANDADNPQTCGYGKTCTLPTVVQGICPEGWHLPSYDEWDALITAVGDKVGQKLKAESNLWNYYEGISNEDSYGFSALPAGVRLNFGYFGDAGHYAYFLSASELDSDNAYTMLLYYDIENAILYSYDKDEGFSVRCLKD